MERRTQGVYQKAKQSKAATNDSSSGSRGWRKRAKSTPRRPQLRNKHIIIKETHCQLHTTALTRATKKRLRHMFFIQVVPPYPNQPSNLDPTARYIYDGTQALEKMEARNNKPWLILVVSIPDTSSRRPSNDVSCIVHHMPLLLQCSRPGLLCCSRYYGLVTQPLRIIPNNCTTTNSSSSSSSTAAAVLQREMYEYTRAFGKKGNTKHTKQHPHTCTAVVRPNPTPGAHIMSPLLCTINTTIIRA